LEKTKNARSLHMKTRMLMHDLRALIAWHRANLSLPAFDDVIRSITVPCLIYAGDQSGEYSKALRSAQEIPGAVFVGIPNGGHLEGGTWIDLLKSHILKVTGALRSGVAG
jgi:pimeloyl-ACP methyl ester carboxylesterase